MEQRIYDVDALGQVFTPEAIVKYMLSLRRRQGRVLEPACGDGAFLKYLPEALGIELDPRHAPPNACVMDFFSLPKTERFETIIGNPPYVRFQNILPTTREKIDQRAFDRRSNLYLFFIEKSLDHLLPQGELIFITPRDFLKATSASRLNERLYAMGTITDYLDLGDLKVFKNAAPNCAIWRFERDNFSRRTRFSTSRTVLRLGEPQLQAEMRHFVLHAGQLLLTKDMFPVCLSALAFVKVGAVSGADTLYVNEHAGTLDFVFSKTHTTGQTRRMIWCAAHEPPPEALLQHKTALMARKIRRFDETNWWQWGRGYFMTDRPRVYVNHKTRHSSPFFTHPCRHYDGSVLAIFPRRTDLNMEAFAKALNRVDWESLGFVCDGRFQFTQRNLEQAPLPERFLDFL